MGCSSTASLLRRGVCNAEVGKTFPGLCLRRMTEPEGQRPLCASVCFCFRAKGLHVSSWDGLLTSQNHSFQ